MPEFVSVVFLPWHNVGMSVKNNLAGHFSDVYSNVNSFRVEGVPNCLAHSLSNKLNLTAELVGEFKRVFIMLFWYNQSMAGIDGIYIKKSEYSLVFIDNFGRNFPSDNFAKQAIFFFIHATILHYGAAETKKMGIKNYSKRTL